MAYTERHNRFTEWWLKVVSWRERHIKERSFIIFLALVVGVICGFAAQLLKFLIHVISQVLTSHLSATTANWLYLVYPVIGIFLVTLFLNFVVKDNISHGVTKVLYAISRRKSRLKKRNMYASLIASSITIGFGGSVGAEGPIVFGGGNRLECGPGIPFVATLVDAFGWLWRRSRHSRDIPGTYRRYAFHT